MAKIKYRIGDTEFEASGGEKFVGEQSEKFIEMLVRIGILKIESDCENGLDTDTDESGERIVETPLVLAPKKHEETGKRKKIDYGKIMALRNAGWNNEKIADEMHMTKASVATAISTYKKKCAEGKICCAQSAEEN